MRQALFIASCCLALVSCDAHLDTDSSQKRAASHVQIDQSSSRFTVTRVQVIEDFVAYNNERGVYVIVDKKTGREYVGVSGVGIAETGLHPSGKSSVLDER